MIRSLRVGNFKAFGATQTVPLKPITLVFGPNSAGKSSIIHALALAHEAARTGSLDVVRTEVGGTSIDLGGFRQYVFRRRAANRVALGVTLGLEGLNRRLADLLAPVRKSFGVEISFGVALDDEERPVPGAEPRILTYELRADDAEVLRMSRRPDGSLAVDRIAEDHPVVRGIIDAVVASRTFKTRVGAADREAMRTTLGELVPQLTGSIAGSWLPDGLTLRDQGEHSPATETPSTPPTGLPGFGSDVGQALRFFMPRSLGDLVREVSAAVHGSLATLHYLGPLRSYPPRHLAFAEAEDQNWRAGGGHAWDVVRRDRAAREAVNRWLGDGERLRTPYELVIRDLVSTDDLREPISAGLDELSATDLTMVEEQDTPWDSPMAFPALEDPERTARRFLELVGQADIERHRELVLVDKRTNTTVSHRDVGIGVSQVLPVLVNAFALDRQLVAIEQPEIHLHPALQADLGDVFIGSALGPRRNTFLLETHSEHLILRILRRIRETTEGTRAREVMPVTPDDVAVLYVQPTPKGTEVSEIPLTDDGDFGVPWPNGFFAERVRELL